jgi:DNA polymerase III subunit epsilon
MRQVVLDTETTGLEVEAGHRVIEIGCVELVNRRITNNKFHRYMNPERPVDSGAIEVHGLDNAFLADQPLFADIAEEFLEFVRGAELVIHNAEFDVGFINAELVRLGNGTPQEIREHCSVLDSLALARRMHPGQRNSLDALAKRYNVDNSRRELHGALLDAEILAEVYLAMTGGQATLSLEGHGEAGANGKAEVRALDRTGLTLAVRAAGDEERAAHEAMLARMRESLKRPTLWERALDPESVARNQ